MPRSSSRLLACLVIRFRRGRYEQVLGRNRRGRCNPPGMGGKVRNRLRSAFSCPPCPPKWRFCRRDESRASHGICERKNGRGERIRTSDPLVPNQVLYQAEPLPVPLSPRADPLGDIGPSAFVRRTPLSVAEKSEALIPSCCNTTRSGKLAPTPVIRSAVCYVDVLAGEQKSQHRAHTLRPACLVMRAAVDALKVKRLVIAPAFLEQPASQ